MPHLFLLIVAVLLSLGWLALGSTLLAASRQMRLLREVLDPEGEVLEPGALPSLSVIVTARDEASGIETTVQRLLAQEYPGLEVVVVDDRSTDGTSAILDRLAAGTAPRPGRLTVIHNRALPDGWLGKCHACRLGAERARGEWLLFTDGDVTLARRDLLARSVRLAGRERLDHVAVTPDTRPMSPLQAGLVSLFGQIFLLAVRAHEMDRDRPRGGGGVGAFNLVRRTAYERVGGHHPLRMDAADDIKLGMLLKESGARQRIYNGLDLILCPWQRGTLNVIRGLEKNFFGGCDYSLARILVITGGLLALTFGPPALALLDLCGAWEPGSWAWQGAAWLPLAIAVGLLGTGYLLNARRFGVSPWLFLLHPVSVLLLVAAAWNSTLRILARGGVRWRGTFYPLADLRRGLVRSGDGRGVRRHEI